MNQNILQRWVSALRSGDYKQGTHRLRSADNKYCCLGVLGDIYAKENKKRWRKSNNDLDEYGLHKNENYLTQEVEEWAGIGREDKYSLSPKVKYQGKKQWLSTLNDDEKLSFTEIADLIEAEWKEKAVATLSPIQPAQLEKVTVK